MGEKGGWGCGLTTYGRQPTRQVWGVGTRAAACALEQGFQGGVAQGGIYGPARVVCKCANG